MPSYVWQTEPPIVFVPKEELKARVDRLCLSIEGYCGEDESWRERAGASFFIAGLAEEQGDDQAYPTFEYRMDGHPVALMVLHLRSDGVVEIKYLVTHPGSENAGGIMIEYALNKADGYNTQAKAEVFEPGLVILESYNENSTNAYLAMGFKVQSRKQLYLNANRNGQRTISATKRE